MELSLCERILTNPYDNDIKGFNTDDVKNDIINYLKKFKKTSYHK